MEDKFGQEIKKFGDHLSQHRYLVRFILALVIVVVLSSAGGGYYFYYKHHEIPSKVLGISIGPSSDPKQVSTQVIDEVGMLMDLPSSETPAVAVVTDVNKLKDVAMFQRAKNGDEILIYSQAKKVIVYDPTSNKIVDVISLSTNITPSPTLNPVQAKLVILNGTSVVGLASKIELDIKRVFPEVDVINKSNTVKDGYPSTLVVPLNSSALNASQNLVNSINAKLSDLPVGELKPANADILVIVGKDKI